MADSDDDATRGTSEGSPGDTQEMGPPLADTPRRGVGALLPAIALVVGLVVGGLFVGLTDLGGSGDQASSSGTSSTGSTSSASSPGSTSSGTPSDVVITVPGACLTLTDDSQELLDLVDQAVTAARDLNASELSSVVSKLKDAQGRLRTQTEACRTAASQSNS